MNEPVNESQLVKKIVLEVQKRYPDAWILKVHGGGYQRAGVPDVLLCVAGRFVAVEVKHRKPGESEEAMQRRVTARQRKEIEDIHRAGGVASVVSSVDEVLALLEDFQKD